MYIVTFYDEGSQEIVVQPVSLRWLANLLEKNKIYFKVSCATGPLKQRYFGCGGFQYWQE